MRRPPVPSLLPVIGWSMLGAVPALLLSGLLGFELTALAREPGGLMMPPGAADGVDLKGLIRPLEGTLRLLSWAQILLAAPLAGVSAAFLRRRRWARAGMEAMTWGMGLLTAGFAFLIVPFWLGLLRAILLLEPQDPLPAAARWMALGGGVVLVALLEIPLALTMRALRSEAIRGACVL